MENEKKELLTIIDENGDRKEAEVLLYFKLEENGKEYVIYTFNEPAGNDLVTVYTSVVKREENSEPVLTSIESDEEWAKIKDVMRQVIKENKE